MTGIKKKNTKVWVFGGLLAILIFFSACQKWPPHSAFSVKVVTPEGHPVAGAILEGGFDWDYFHAKTNEEGMASLPQRAWNQAAVIYKNNFFTLYVPHLLERTYTLTPTPDSLVPLGEVKGRALRFENGTLLTLTYQGEYHVYEYTENSVVETYSQSLPAIAVKDVEIQEDRLWVCTHDDGIYVFSLTRPEAPELLFHLDVPGYLSQIEVMDSLLILTMLGGPIKVLRYHEDGTWQELATMDIVSTSIHALTTPYLGVVGRGIVMVLDLNLPDHPQVVWIRSDPNLYEGLFHGDTVLLLMEDPWQSTPPFSYQVLDFTNPTAPVEIGTFSARYPLIDFLNDSTAIGASHRGPLPIFVLRGDLQTTFEPVAEISEWTVAPEDYGGSSPPYFIIDETLWKLKIHARKS